jgi:hypothetical protein
VIGRALRAYALPLAVAAALGALCIAGILRQAGEPALPLDDSFIHLQYARRLGEGSFFSFVPGEGYSTGATSWLWPLLVAPFWALGLRDLDLVWVVWGLGALAHAGVMLETARVAAPLCGRAGALLAAALCAVFGAFAWFAYSGMETVALSWILMRTVRVAAESCEAPPPGRRSLRVELALLGLLAPLLRPEGAIASLIAVIAATRWRPRLGAMLVPACGPAVIPVAHLLLAGHAASATAQVKLLIFDPYLDPWTMVQQVLGQVRFLVGDLLQGNPWTTIFLPTGFGVVLCVGLGALTVGAWRPEWIWLGDAPPRRRTRERAGASRPPRPAPGPAPLERVGPRWRIGFVWLVALGTLVPCTYGTLLWNRVRYLWPFAPSWFVAVACLGSALGLLAARLRPSLALCGPAALGALTGAFAAKLPWSMSDLAESARAIDRQQVELGRWAAVLPADARIGVNDTGAIAYLSGRRTFDVVGLTTESETRYWLAGAGSRFEHYERLGRAALPTHFFVYPEWMLCSPVLGRELHRATVLDQSILGGTSMVAYEARYDLLGSGARPFAPRSWGELLDELDVADLESEQAHGYVLWPARAADDVVAMWPTPDGRVVADGGRLYRVEDRFVAHLRAAGEVLLAMRIVAASPLELWLDGKRLEAPSDVAAKAEPWGWEPEETGAGPAPADGKPAPWVERVVPVGALSAGDHAVVVRPSDGTSFASYHYWWFRK